MRNCRASSKIKTEIFTMGYVIVQSKVNVVLEELIRKLKMMALNFDKYVDGIYD